MEEEWVDLEGWPKYKISSYGNVYNLQNGRYVKSSVHTRGFVGVNLEKDGKYSYVSLARLVALAFVDGFFDTAEVGYIDGNKLNISADNLEWVTHWQNTQWNSGRRDYIRRGYINKETLEIEWEGGPERPQGRTNRDDIIKTGILNRETGEVEWE